MKKIPMRKCLGCQQMLPKRDLIRVVRSPEGILSLDARGKKPGRGAYVCRNADCLKKAVRSKAIERSLEASVPEELLTALLKEMEEADG